MNDTGNDTARRWVLAILAHIALIFAWYLFVKLGNVPKFNRRCYDDIRALGWGETTTYGAIARRLGDVALSRAVGAAMGANPIPLIVPCHRVLASDGRSGGFSAPGGVEAKLRMLALEHATSPTGQFSLGF